VAAKQWLALAEGIEACAAVVMTHAARPDAAGWKPLVLCIQKFLLAALGEWPRPAADYRTT
jgi:hypothetical protein